jgi:hypothetical protein
MPTAWTDTTLSQVVVKDDHFNELVTAINDYYNFYGMTASPIPTAVTAQTKIEFSGTVSYLKVNLIDLTN